MEDKEFRITRKNAPFVFQICKSFNDWKDIYMIDPEATEVSINMDNDNLTVRFYYLKSK